MKYLIYIDEASDEDKFRNKLVDYLEDNFGFKDDVPINITAINENIAFATIIKFPKPPPILSGIGGKPPPGGSPINLPINFLYPANRIKTDCTIIQRGNKLDLVGPYISVNEFIVQIE